MNTPSNDPAVILRTQLAAAARRWRAEWLSRTLGWVGFGLAVGFSVWAVLTLALPKTAHEWPAGLLLAVGILVLVFVESRLRSPDWPRIRRRVDQRLGLPDAVLSAAEFQESANDRWTAQQLAQTSARLQRVDWQRAWPVRATHRTRAAWLVALLAMAFVGWRFSAVRASELPPPPTAQALDSAKTLKEVLDDWDKSEQEQHDPELKKLLDELKPLREKLAQKDAALDERAAFKELSRIEDKLAAIQAKIDAQSLQPMAADLAAALEKVDGLGALAAAVRQKDFEKAEEQAEKAAQELQQPGAKPPQGAQAAEAAQQFEKLAQKMGQKGNQAGQQSMQQMQNGLQKKQSSEMGKGMESLKQCLGNQNARDGQKKSLANQLKQMGAGKEGAGKGQCMSRSVSMIPKLSMMRSKQPGKGADRSTDPNRSGAATALAADRQQDKVNGTANEQGESETTNLSTLDPSKEHAGPGVAANFRSYQALSQQAVADENLPLAHRQTIKRYFESIRPAGQDKN